MARVTNGPDDAGKHGRVADLPVKQPSLLDALRTSAVRDGSAGGRLRASPRVAGLVLVPIALVLTFIAVANRAPAQIAPPATHTSSAGSPASDSGSGGVFVHVAGAVRRPGLYELTQGARVADAISAAGGALRKANVDAVNLAQVIADGMKIEVPERGEAGSVATSDASSSGLVSINSAGFEELETLPGVGPVTAQAIVSHREESGAFISLEELLDVSGIGPATFAEIRPHVTL